MHYSSKNIYANNNEYIKLRNKQESNVITPNISVLYTHYITNKTNISLGLSLHKFGENTNYNLLSTIGKDSTITIDTMQILSWDSINNLVYVRYNVYEKDTIVEENLNLKNRNRHTYITVPILIGRNLSFNKWNINIQAGIGISFLLKSNARYINYEFTNFISNNPKRFITNYIISPSVGYKINNKIQLTINPNCIFNAQNLIKYKEVKQYYYNYGLNFGISYSI